MVNDCGQAATAGGDACSTGLTHAHLFCREQRSARVTGSAAGVFIFGGHPGVAEALAWWIEPGAFIS